MHGWKGLFLRAKVTEDSGTSADVAAMAGSFIGLCEPQGGACIQQRRAIAAWVHVGQSSPI
eukprot:2688043-Pyramimonas_sp.AAC.1